MRSVAMYRKSRFLILPRNRVSLIPYVEFIETPENKKPGFLNSHEKLLS